MEIWWKLDCQVAATLRFSSSWSSGRKGRTKKLVKVGSILLLKNGRWRNFHIPEQLEKPNFNISEF